MTQCQIQGPPSVSNTVIASSTMACGYQLLGKCYILNINSSKSGYKSLIKMKNTFLFHWSHLSNKCLRNLQLNQCFQSPEIKLSFFHVLDRNDLCRWNSLAILVLLTEWHYHQCCPIWVIYFQNNLGFLQKRKIISLEVMFIEGAFPFTLWIKV